jgi:iron complex outermembrane recepter protein
VIHNILPIGLSVLLGLIFHANLQANEEENIDDVTPYYLEDVIVTAERRETSIQKTPITISTFSSKEIEDLNINYVPDIAQRVPGLTVGNSSNFSAPDIYLRGVGTRDFTIGGDLSIGFYVDDVYIGRSGDVFVDMFDLERIEILKGPQGTLWGRNAVAGAIHTVTSKPSNTLEVKQLAEYGRFDQLRLTGTLSGPLLNDTLLGKVSYSVRDRDGFTNNVFDGSDINDAENISGRGSFWFLPTDNIDFLLSLDYSKDRPKAIALKNKSITGAAALFGHVEPDGPFNVNHDTDGREHRDSYGASGKLSWDMGKLSLVSISAFRGYQVDSLDDADSISFKLAEVLNQIDQTQFTQEFRLFNKPNGKLKWLFGTYLFHEETENIFIVDSSDFALALGVGDYIATNFSSITANSYSVFGQLNYALTERLSATVGARYTYEEKDFTSRRDGAVGFAVIGAPDPGFQLTAFDEDWQAFTPKVGLEFQQTKDLFWYASISRGFRSGGFNALQSVVQEAFNPEFLLAYEVGVKSDWLNRKLQANLALFYYDHTDLQVTTVTGAVGGAPVVVTSNAAEAREFGAEVSILALPMQGLEINTNLSFLDAEYTEFISGTNNFAGNSINHSPAFSSHFGIQYSLPMRDYGFLTVGAEHQYQTKIFFTEANQDVLSQGDYHNLNARIGFETYDGHFSLSLFGNNLTNEETVQTGVDLQDTLGLVNHAFNPPRTYGIKFAVNF